MGERLTPPCPKIVQGQQHLTPAQEAYARQFAREQMAAMLSTATSDEQEAEGHLRAAYRAVGLEPPYTIRWFDSPLALVQTYVPYLVQDRYPDCISHSSSVQHAIWQKLHDIVETSVYDPAEADLVKIVQARHLLDGLSPRIQYRVKAILHDSVGDNKSWDQPEARKWPHAVADIGTLLQLGVWDNVLDLLKHGVWPSAADLLQHGAWHSIEDLLEPDVWPSAEGLKEPDVRPNAADQQEPSVWYNAADQQEPSVWPNAQDYKEKVLKRDGNVLNCAQDCVGAYDLTGLLAFYRFFHEMFADNMVVHLARFNEMVSGYWLGDDDAWVVRKPTLLALDSQRRPHSTSGPSIEYRDSWHIYAWHGVRVPAKLILHPEQVTRENWMQESNLEVRRAIQERLGNERFISLMGGVCLDKSERGSLIEITLGDHPERIAHYVQVQDSSTERQYYLRVPPSITKADDAIAWTFGLSARNYQPGQET